MYISEQHLKTDSVNKVRVFRREKGQRAEEAYSRVLSEHFLEVYVNDRPAMKLVCEAEFLTELVLGRLLSEGMIESGEDVESVCISRNGSRADVFLKENVPAERPAGKIAPIQWKEEWIYRLEKEFAMDTPLHRETKSTHSCFLAREGETIIRCEDIGRHNALDKVIGYGLRHGVDLSRSMVYSSGRIPTDMVIKVIRSGIPILVSKESPTRNAVELAGQFGLTLICNAKGDGFNQYTGF